MARLTWGLVALILALGGWNLLVDGMGPTRNPGDKITIVGPGPFTSPCDGPMEVWMVHDVDDNVLPIADARDSRDFWAGLNGCGSTLGRRRR